MGTHEFSEQVERLASADNFRDVGGPGNGYPTTVPDDYLLTNERSALVVGLDAVAVVVFALLGRRAHESGDGGGNGVVAVLEVAWPFLVGLAAGHALVRGSATLRSGLVLWLCTLVGGMLLRRLTGDGTALAFVLVATGFLGATLLGWRLVVLLVRLRQAQ